jgi:hypothetical protein
MAARRTTRARVAAARLFQSNVEGDAPVRTRRTAAQGVHDVAPDQQLLAAAATR